MEHQTESYNSLLPPENPAYPWVPKDWQLLCYYCCQPIYETVPVAGFKQRTVYMRGRWRHKHNDELHCIGEEIRPTDLIDDPRCHICHTQTAAHAGVCSAAGKPPFYAMPMSQKEQELIGLFGWK